MSEEYPVRWRATCPCGWSAGFYDRSRASGAAETHGALKPGHTAGVQPAEAC